MAIVDEIRPETIELLRGTIDFYLLRGILPVARSWPKKPKPPYTALQAEAMAVFAIANGLLPRLTGSILEVWRINTFGIRPSWTDVFRGLIMSYWKNYKVIAPVAMGYEVVETLTQFKVKWSILQVFIDPLTPEVLSDLTTALIDKSEISIKQDPIYFTLYNDYKIRCAAPFILFKV